MSGFVGLINKDHKNISLPVLIQMAEKISHRGPDEEGEFIDGNLGLYHKRLSVIDLPEGKQPMILEDFVIVFDGRIYNYVELREELILKGISFKTGSDTEVILQLYKLYGEELLPMLNGMFAFIIYDKNKNRIFAARDHFGIKPLYWFENKQLIIFGSEIKAILAHPKIQAKPDLNSIYEYLTFQFVIGGQTMFGDIFKLEPGHFMTVSLNDFNSQFIKYWEPDFTLDLYHTEEYFIVELRRMLEEIVYQQIRSDVPVGTYLSGGIDSSLITILVSELYNKPLKSFTGVFKEGPEFNELEYARETANLANAELFEVYPGEKEFIDILPKLIYHLDEPVAGPGIFPQFIVSRLAKEHVKVVLGGQGGDEIFGGYARYIVAYLEQALKGAIFETNEEAEHIVSLRSILPNLPALKTYIPMIKSFWENGAFETMDKRYFHLINRMGSTINYLSPDFVSGFDEKRLFSKFSRYFNNSNTLSYFNKMTQFDMAGSLPGLLQVEDRISMALSLEARVPLLDRRIVDLISKMPAGMKFKGAEMKYLLKKTVKDILPEKILMRKDKMGFPVPLHIWLKNESRDFVMDVFLSQKARERNIIDTQCVEKLIRDEKPFGRGLWGLLSLELWFREFIDK